MIVVLTLTCDIPTCEAELVAHGNHEEHAARRLLRMVRAADWEIAGDRHRCRHHRRLPA